MREANGNKTKKKKMSIKTQNSMENQSQEILN